MLYSIYDYNALSGLSYSVERQPEMSINGGKLFLKKDRKGDLVIDGMFSTDPSDYLKEEYVMASEFEGNHPIFIFFSHLLQTFFTFLEYDKNIKRRRS